MKCLFLLLVCLGLTKLAATQARFAGIVNSNEAKPISNASVLLLNTKDSSLVKGVTTNNSGAFLLEKIAPGNYIAVISNEGFHDKYFPADLLNQKTFDIGVIVLSPVSKELKEVVVTGKKPLYEQKIDRMVINVKNSITSAGGTVLEVLEKSPGVTVDRSTGSVSLNGKDGVMVMINGKMSYMPQEALLQMLNGVNASNVERIELITTPPAKYDAGGNAGYINIVLLANPDEGFNGSYSLSGGVGSGSVVNASTNFNYRKKKINLYGSYAFSRDGQLQVFESHRSVVFEGNLNAIDIISNRDPFQRNHNARLGMDYKAGKKTVIGVLLGGYDNKWSMDAVNKSQSSINGQPDTSIVINNQEVNHWRNAMGNVNLQHNFKAGEEFTFNTDFLYYKNNNPTDYQNAYYDKTGSYLHTDNTSSTKETIIKVFVSQADYSKKINDKASMEMGIKGSFSKFTNDVLVQEEIGGVWVPDPKYTANYYLNEEIFAAYISGDARMGNNTSLKAGLRYEYTSSNLGSETEKDIVDRKYGKLFPTLFISQKLNDNNTVNFSYNRRINRPSFTQLAPFLIFFDPKTFITGNPALQPGIMDAVKVDYIIKRLVFSASYSYEDNAITRFLSEVDSTDNSQITMSQNLDKSQLVYVSASLPTRITPWWNSQLNLAVNWNKVNAVINKEAAEFSQVYYRITGAETFKLPKEFSIELSGFYQSKSLFGAFEVQPFGGLNAAIQKKFKNSGALTFGVDNIFNSYKFKVSQSVASQHIESKGVLLFSQRLFKLTWSQNFGSKVLKDKRNRTTASEEERRRVE